MSLALVKELRERTGAGMLDCKKALEEANGNIEEAIAVLREKGIAKAEKKQSRIAAEGLTKVVNNENKAVVIEVNSETDFVAKNEKFQEFINKTANAILNSEVKTLEEANALEIEGRTIADYVIELTAIIGEKISFRRVAVLEKTSDELFGVYTHGNGKISTVVVLKGGNRDLAFNMALQVTSMKPKYLTREDVPSEEIEKEKTIITEQVINEGVSAEEKKGQMIIEGRLNKMFFHEICLMEQGYIDNEKVSVAQILKEANAELKEFARFEVGEGLEKRVDDFAKEVMDQINM